MNVSYES